MGKKKLRRAERVLQKQKEAGIFRLFLPRNDFNLRSDFKRFVCIASSTAVEKILPDELLPPAARAKDGDITGKK